MEKPWGYLKRLLPQSKKRMGLLVMHGQCSIPPKVEKSEAAKALMRATLLRLAPPKAVKAIMSGQFQLAMKDPARFDYMRISNGMITLWFSRMNWEVIAAEDNASFITTDSPVSFYNPCLLDLKNPVLEESEQWFSSHSARGTSS